GRVPEEPVLERAPRGPGGGAQRQLEVHPAADPADRDLVLGQLERRAVRAARSLPLPVLQPGARDPGGTAGAADRHEPEPPGKKGSRALGDRLSGQPQERGQYRDAAARTRRVPPRDGGTAGGAGNQGAAARAVGCGELLVIRIAP